MGKRRQKNFVLPAGAAAPGSAEPEVWTLARLAAALSIELDQAEQLQGAVCVAGEDFIDAAGETVLTASGIKKIRERVHEEQLGAAPAIDAASLPSPADVDYGPPARPLHREDLRLTRVFRWSTNVLAETASGNEVVLHVRSIAHLLPGMVLRGCIRDQMGWTYDGRLPRTLGERQLYFPPRPAATTQPKR